METQCKQYPILYGKSRVGKIKTWQITVQQSLPSPTITTIHNYIDGKKQTDTLAIVTGKNIGRANETTPFEQHYILQDLDQYSKQI